ncbi:hypothetical protein HYALB_00002804 [Hymenoscyphus albidus]|uniref:BHLH domain-containing protein n=1 Tax=Hymenoscyphus albidus TaxID=595503 RepID=A0A9N9LF07_9HELO|nr:hypothetical protein HYALB_00002804 [Hymenoscyphus albidus]
MMDTSGVWDNQDPTLSIPSQDDFNQFLDIGMNGLGDALHYDFQDFGGQPPAHLLHQHGQGQMGHSGLGNSVGQGHDTTMQEHMPPMTTATSHSVIIGTPMSHTHHSTESLSDLDAQIQYLQHQKLQRQRQQQQQHQHIQEQQRNFYVHNRMIPPTPNSMELHANTSQFYPQSDPQPRAVYERYQMQMKDQEMAFTPLVSPAVTPLEPHFNIPEYTVPGAYFSPLSSPAIRAQNEQQSNLYDQRLSATTNSPIDMNMESNSASTGSGVLAKKTNKKAVPKARATRAIRQSPIVKPKRSKRGPIVNQALGEILEPSHFPIPSKELSCSRSAPSTEESENSSISPEHLSDMAPPPVPTPGSHTRSPYIPAQKDDPRNKRLVLGSPATPASLMRLTQSPQVNEPSDSHTMDLDDPAMDSFALPEAANTTRPQLVPLNTQSDGQMTPTLNSNGAKTPGFQPLPSSVTARPRNTTSASSSPQIDSMNGGGATKRPTQSGGRSIKKRAGSSVLASPALLPRISPSIKPLMPGSGTLSENTASLLLASKSNYQNILEGTHLPGVTYPSELSTNLTSKRTSHKIAEQGRRNRINSALQEIATLLPRGSKESSGEKSGSGEAEEGNEPSSNAKGGAQSANSKASTVEQAIEYIKQLKNDLADAQKRAEEAEKRLKESV